MWHLEVCAMYFATTLSSEDSGRVQMMRGWDAGQQVTRVDVIGTHFGSHRCDKKLLGTKGIATRTY